MSLDIQHKQLQFKAVVGAGDGTPTEDELKLINSYALRELAADEVYVRRMYLAHNAIDRDRDVFSNGLLDDFAKTLPGKGVFIKHPQSWDGDSGPGEGIFIGAEVEKMSTAEAIKLLGELNFLPETKEAHLLKATYFIPRIEGDQENKRLITKIDTGVIRYVSIGFTADSRKPFEEAGGKFLANVLHGPGEALEGSFVWLGAQPGARNAKTLGNQEEKRMDDIKQLQGEVATLKVDLKAAEKLADENATGATAHKNIKKAVGELADNPAELKAAVEAGENYRKSLTNSIIKSKRLMEMMGDSEEDQKEAEDFYKSMPLQMLKKEAEALTAKAPEGGSIEGGEPNTTGTGGKDPKEEAEQKGATVDPVRSDLSHL